jgi:hypothetical protein
MNIDGLLQAFERAIPPREGVKFDGQFFARTCPAAGLFRAAKIREQMAGGDAGLGRNFRAATRTQVRPLSDDADTCERWPAGC